MDELQSAVAVYPSHVEAEAAIKELQRAGFDMRRLSIVGKDYHTEEDVVGYINTGERVRMWGKAGAFWGGVWGLLVGVAMLWVPGYGPVAAAGELVALILSALEGAIVVGGLSAIGAALFSLGIPKDSVIQYETALKAGQFVLVVHGTQAEVERAKELLERGAAQTATHGPATQPAGAASSAGGTSTRAAAPVAADNLP
jgi:hypothetical protein